MRDKLRITGGERRGRKLFSPPTDTIRPASDMIRQAVFNMLQADVAGCTFIDVFAGTGIVGMEALSRNAEQALFVEKDRDRVLLIHKNLKLARFDQQAQVRRADAFSWGRYYVFPSERVIIFLGPPYPLFDSQPDRMTQLVTQLQERLRPDDILVLQFPSTIDGNTLPGQPWWYRVRKYGKTKVGIWRPPAWPGHQEDEEPDDPASEDELQDDVSDTGEHDHPRDSDQERETFPADE